MTVHQNMKNINLSKPTRYAPLKMVKSWGRKIVKDIQKSKKELKEKTVK